MSGKKFEVSDNRDLGAFIPSALDDYGLDPYEFRVYARLARRAGKAGAFESVANIAKACKVGEQKVKEVLRFLLEAEMVERHSRTGQSSVYTLRPQQDWIHPEQLEAIRAVCSHNKKQAIAAALDSLLEPGFCENLGSESTRNPGSDRTENLGSESTHKGITNKVLNEGIPPNPLEGGRRSRSKLENPYERISNLDGFENFWIWYNKKICTIALEKFGRKSKSGTKSEAAAAWFHLEQNNYHGLGLDGFRVACREYLKEAIASDGVGTLHAHRFLSGGKYGEPQWLTLYQDNRKTVSDTFLEGVDEGDDLTEIHKAIAGELRRTGLGGVLPSEWQQKTGVQLVSALNVGQSRQYLQWLRSQEERRAS